MRHATVQEVTLLIARRRLCLSASCKVVEKHNTNPKHLCRIWCLVVYALELGHRLRSTSFGSGRRHFDTHLRIIIIVRWRDETTVLLCHFVGAFIKLYATFHSISERLMYVTYSHNISDTVSAKERERGRYGGMRGISAKIRRHNIQNQLHDWKKLGGDRVAAWRRVRPRVDANLVWNCEWWVDLCFVLKPERTEREQTRRSGRRI